MKDPIVVLAQFEDKLAYLSSADVSFSEGKSLHTVYTSLDNISQTRDPILLVFKVYCNKDVHNGLAEINDAFSKVHSSLSAEFFHPFTQANSLCQDVFVVQEACTELVWLKLFNERGEDLGCDRCTDFKD